MSRQDILHYRSARLRHVVMVACAVNLAAALAKIIYGEITHSVAMGADGMHPALDVVASLVALVGISLATRPPAPRHPYGYDRYESVAALLVGGFLVLALVHILGGAISRLRHPEIIGGGYLPRGVEAGVVAHTPLVARQGRYPSCQSE